MTRGEKIIRYMVVPLAACFVLYMLEQVLLVDYFVKTAVKILLFTGIPTAVWLLSGSKPGQKDEKIVGWPRFGLGIIIGMAVFAVVVLTYGLSRHFIDFMSIMTELNEKSKITRDRYLYTGVYITFGNSFLEEFFFRKYIFWNMVKSSWVKTGYIFSAVLFSVYHLAIMNTWFSPFILVVALIGLFVAGMFLNYIVVKTNSMLSAWIVHICANIAIIGIGYLWLL